MRSHPLHRCFRRACTWTYGTCHVVIWTPHGVYGQGRDCTPPAGTPPDWEGLPDIPPAVESGAGKPDPERTLSPRGEEGSASIRGHAGSDDPGGVDGRGAGLRGERALPTGLSAPHGRGDRPVRIAGAPGTPDTLTTSEQNDPPVGPESSPLMSSQISYRQGGKELHGQGSSLTPNNRATP